MNLLFSFYLTPAFYYVDSLPSQPLPRRSCEVPASVFDLKYSDLISITHLQQQKIKCSQLRLGKSHYYALLLPIHPFKSTAKYNIESPFEVELSYLNVNYYFESQQPPYWSPNADKVSAWCDDWKMKLHTSTCFLCYLGSEYLLSTLHSS